MLPSGIWNLESWVLGSRIQPKESGIQLKIGIQSPSSTDRESGVYFIEFGIHGVESRIQLCLRIPYMEPLVNT